MATPTFPFPAHYMRLVADLIRGCGGDSEAWLAAHGIDAAALASGAIVLSPLQLEALLSSALQMAREPALGLLLGERLVASTHGFVGHAAMNSSTLRQALEFIAKYTQLRLPLLSVHLETVSDEARLCFGSIVPLGRIERPLLEAVMLSVRNMLEGLSLGFSPVQAAAFSFDAPEYADLAHSLFRCDLSFSQPWAGLVVNSKSLDLPLKISDPEAFREAALMCERELEKRMSATSTVARVRMLLLERPHGFPSLPVAARLLHMTPRTLHRRLVDEGCTFRDVLEDVRHGLAMEHARAGRLSVEEMSYALGYSDTANFRRAFKRWESQPPSAFRKPRAGSDSKP